MPFPNQFQIGNPDNEPGKLEIQFDNLLVESLQRQSSQQVKKQNKAERRRRGKKKMNIKESSIDKKNSSLEITAVNNWAEEQTGYFDYLDCGTGGWSS